MIESYDEHHITFFCSTDEHISQEADMIAYIEECESVLEGVLSDEQTDSVRRFRLKIAVFDIKYLVKESAHMET